MLGNWFIYWMKPKKKFIYIGFKCHIFKGLGVKRRKIFSFFYYSKNKKNGLQLKKKYVKGLRIRTSRLLIINKH